jgi:hypothetical protein
VTIRKYSSGVGLMRLDAIRVRVLIGCVFVRVVLESETCHGYQVVLQTIKVATRNLSGPSNSLT